MCYLTPVRFVPLSYFFFLSWQPVQHSMCDTAEGAARILDSQLRWYRRERLACRLKLYCVVQLLGSFWYAFAPHGLRSCVFGGLCACGAAHGFYAAATCGRRLLKLQSLFTMITALCGMALLASVVKDMILLNALHVTSFQLHITFAMLTLAQTLLQLPVIHVCSAILLLHAEGRGGALLAEAHSFLVEEIKQELLDIDLAVTPPYREELERSSIWSDRSTMGGSGVDSEEDVVPDLQSSHKLT